MSTLCSDLIIDHQGDTLTIYKGDGHRMTIELGDLDCPRDSSGIGKLALDSLLEMIVEEIEHNGPPLDPFNPYSSQGPKIVTLTEQEQEAIYRALVWTPKE